jgi:SAM-dependent methyltransferase
MDAPSTIISMQAQFNPDSSAAWQVRIFKKSAPRQAVVKQLQRLLPPCEGKDCLDIGGRDGMTSVMLRQRGGNWHSADARPAAVTYLEAEFGPDRASLLSGPTLPFEENSFDIIVVQEHLECLRDHATFIKECHRCLRPKGLLFLHVPHIKSFSTVHGLRSMLGMKDSDFGRVRPGYRLRDLYEISKDGFDIVESRTFGGFLEECIHSWVLAASGGADAENPEHYPPPESVPEQQILRKIAKRYRVHALLYPLALPGRGLDTLLQFTCNHHLVVQLKPRPWLERRGVSMRDGRSIADATINTKIGTAADLTDPKNNRSSA